MPPTKTFGPTVPTATVGRRVRRTREVDIGAQLPALLVLTGDRAGQYVPIVERLIIGRDHDADLLIDSDDVSRRHARLRRLDAGQVVIEDLGSQNGTWVNGARIELHPLQSGDRIQLGANALFVYSCHAAREDQLVRWQRTELVGQLACSSVHDLNNYLAILVSNIEYLQLFGQQDRVPSPEQLSECLSEMLVAANHGAALTRRMLDLSRHSEREFVELSVGELVDELELLVKRTLPPEITLRVDCDERLRVRGDRSQLLQMLVNIVLNARDAMPGGGTITIRGQSKSALEIQSELGADLPLVGYCAVLEVSDTGQGMSEEVAAQACEPLFTTKDCGRGTGLGLASAVTIAERHSGELRLHSQLGHGTKVSIWLPEASAARRAADAAAACAERIDLFLIDDDPAVRQQIEAAMVDGGCRLRCHADLKAALDDFAANSGRIEFAIIRLDLAADDERSYAKLIEIDCSVRLLLCSGDVDRRVRTILAHCRKECFNAKKRRGAPSRR